MIQLTNKQTIWYRIRIFGDDHHMGDFATGNVHIEKIYAGRTDFMPKWKSLVLMYRGQLARTKPQ